MTPADELLVARIGELTQGAAALLRGLARHGKAIERDQPVRASQLIGAVVTHPLYKGGRLAFDMLEIEDVMLAKPDSHPPSLSELSDAVRAAVPSSARVAEALARLAPPPVEADGDLPRIRLAPAPPPVASNDLPPLTAADYLFDYVVLGLLDVLSREPGESVRPFEP